MRRDEWLCILFCAIVAFSFIVAMALHPNPVWDEHRAIQEVLAR
jgi:hypothetical protein